MFQSHLWRKAEPGEILIQAKDLSLMRGTSDNRGWQRPIRLTFAEARDLWMVIGAELQSIDHDREMAK